MRSLRRLWRLFRPRPASPVTTRRSPAPIRDSGDLPQLRLVAVPGPFPGGPADVLLIRGTDAFLVSYGELLLVVATAAELRDELARYSTSYRPAEVPLPAAPFN